MKQIFSLLLLLIAGMVSVKADNITVGGTSRSYNKIVPKNLGENRPLLIFCHGYNQDAKSRITPHTYPPYPWNER